MLDLGGKESQICVRDAKENILDERRCLTKRLGEYLAKQPPSRVILELPGERHNIARTRSSTASTSAASASVM